MSAPLTPGAPRPEILVVSSQVVRGAVGGRVAVFALERLGFKVWFLPTVLLPWHPGQGRGTRHVASDETFTALVEDLLGADTLANIGAVVSGYLGAPSQAHGLARLVDRVKQVNPDAFYLCDPVCGDHNGLYLPEETATAIRDELLPRADVATPNLFELEWMSGLAADTEQMSIAAARSLAPARVLVTSAPALRRNAVSNLLVTAKGAIAAEHGIVPDAPNGTGDLMSALFAAHLLDGLDDESALKRAAGTTFEMVARSVRQGARDLLIASEQASLVGPMAMVSCRRILDLPIRA
ncbi:pyridoxal kinase [Stappia taiwanensis]|uniref:pyridoxal kinase n=1 Tax=Stappia taiwanensis TaxID=992267 RepID=A0A838XNS3_9HYPH|nr:pyridoxal kinase [Stappia taiwanensis]MBA4611427.1 pyridoxal kinase [Stappia taiwanensis]GGF00412.1 pyridoxal kinase [Stappia taiwanensis]